MDILFWLVTLLTTVALLIGILYLYMSHVFTYWEKKGVAYMKPSFPMGNVYLVPPKTFGLIHADIYNQLREHKFAGLYLMHKPTLFVMHPELVKSVLVRDFDHFHDHGFPFEESLDPIRANLFFLNGEKWKKLRNKLSPTFTSGKLKMMFPTLVECGQLLGKCLEEQANNGDVVEMKDFLGRYGTDVIASVAFGIQCNCLTNPDAEFRKWGLKVINPSVTQNLIDMLHFIMPKVMATLRIAGTPKDLTEFFYNVVKETVEYRENNDVKGNDFMQLLIQLKNQGTVEDDDGVIHKVDEQTKLTMMEVAAQAFVFFQAGSETGSTSGAFCLYELAVNPEIQDRVRDDIDTALEKHNGNISYEAIQSMSYLDKVVSETLRKYPTLPFLSRECTKDYKFPDSDFILEKGQPIIIPVLAIHYDPEFYPEPEKFDPERFNEEVKSKRPNITYFPFGEGPRQCIGMRFALLQVKIGLVSLLSKYEFHVCRETKVPIQFERNTVLLMPVGGIKLQITTRSK